MGSEKSSRQVNLVIALLATKKFLTKPQIFRAVAGYDGSQEASDRMFERDKEELRALGIEIEMKSIDPLFDDEIGYRISPDNYRLNIGPLTESELITLALAAQAWRESSMEDIARTTALRLESLGIVSDFASIPNTNIGAPLNVPEDLVQVLEAVENRRLIQIKYLNVEEIAEEKELAPHGVYSKSGYWYLYALDNSNNQFKNYRFDRFASPVKILKRSFNRSEVTLPELHFPQFETVLEVLRDQAPELVYGAEILEDTEDWIKIRKSFESQYDALQKVLKETPNVRVLEPLELVNEITNALDRLIKNHEH